MEKPLKALKTKDFCCGDFCGQIFGFSTAKIPEKDLNIFQHNSTRLWKINVDYFLKVPPFGGGAVSEAD